MNMEKMMNEIKIDKTANVSEQAKVGNGTVVWQYCTIMSGAVIGEQCKLGANVFVESDVVLGNRVKVKNNIAIYSGVKCEDDVFLGTNCVFTNVINPRSFIERKTEFKETIIKQGATVGANATIVCGNTIGKYALIGAGAVVTKDIPDYALVMGNPGRVKGFVCKCGNKLEKNEEDFICKECGNTYAQIAGKLVPVEEK